MAASDSTEALRLAQVLCSRLCHDLVGPVSAISNGIELMDELEGDMVDEALELVGNSAREVGRRLAFQRLAFGNAGGAPAVDPVQLCETSIQYLEASRIELDWPRPTSAEAWPNEIARLTLCLLQMAVDALPAGGSIKVDAASPATISFEASGRDAGLRPEFEAALAGTEAELDPRTVHVVLAAIWAAKAGRSIEQERLGPDCVRLTLGFA